MWIINAIFLIGGISFVTWFYYTYKSEIIDSFGFLTESTKSIVFVIFLFLIQIIKSLVFGALAGGAMGLILKIAGAPYDAMKSGAIAVGFVVFLVVIIKFIIEDWQNLRWSIRNEARNRYRRW